MVYEVDGRPRRLTKAAAYRGAMLGAVARRCDCELDYECFYHQVLRGASALSIDQLRRGRAVMDRLVSIYKAQDAKAPKPVHVDLSHLTKAEVEAIMVSADWHLGEGKHR